jgi:hypothetical protein
MHVCQSRSLLVSSVFCILSSVTCGSDGIPADPQPQWFKGNLHTHSLWSDGDDFPEMIAEWYRDRGYHFLALTDHNVTASGQKWKKIADVDKRSGTAVFEKYLTRFGGTWVETRDRGDDRQVRLKPLEEYRCLVEERGRFLLLNAEEISDTAEGVPVHMNASNLDAAIQPAGGTTVQEAINANLTSVEEQARRSGRAILPHINHPNFGWAITAEDLAMVVRERFFEIYNGHPGVNQRGDAHRPNVDRLWDIANTIRIGHLAAAPLYGIATDDSHSYHKPNGARPGRGWIMVRATHLTPESLIRSIRAGDCYASSGVTLRKVEYDRDHQTLTLEIEPQANATYTTHFIGTLHKHDAESRPTLDEQGRPIVDKAGKPLRVSRTYSNDIGRTLATEGGLRPQYRLTGDELYVRAVVTASNPSPDPSFEGQQPQAWTQPVGWESRISSTSTKPPAVSPQRSATPSQSQ